jgi:hypothetical protein
VSFIESKAFDDHGDDKPAVCLGRCEGSDLFGRVKFAAPLVLETEVPAKTDPAEFRGESFARGCCRDRLRFRCTAFSQPPFGVGMQADFRPFPLCLQAGDPCQDRVVSGLCVAVAVPGECVSMAPLISESEVKLCAPLMVAVAPSTMMSCRS